MTNPELRTTKPKPACRSKAGHSDGSPSAVRNSRFLILLAAFFAILLIDTTAFAQCSMCRTALESSAEGQAIAGGFRKGIVLLLAAPYAIFGTVSVVVYRAYRKKKKDAAL